MVWLKLRNNWVHSCHSDTSVDILHVDGSVAISNLTNQYGIVFKNRIYWLDEASELSQRINDYNFSLYDNLPSLPNGYQHSLVHFHVSLETSGEISSTPKFYYGLVEPVSKEPIPLTTYLATLPEFGDF